MTRGGRQLIPRPPHWRPDRQPEWVGSTELAAGIDVERLVRLGGPPRSGSPDPMTGIPAGWRQAAVLVPFHLPPEAVTPELLLVRRRNDAPTHAGEVAFPGGVRSEGEALADTALRETEEEAGVLAAHVNLRCRLPVTQTFASKFAITPFVGTVHDIRGLRPQETEIESVLRVPVEDLLAEGTYRAEIWEYGETRVAMSFFEIEGETVWGFTARVIRQILDDLFGSGPDPSVPA